jgi:hypothetical protein
MSKETVTVDVKRHFSLDGKYYEGGLHFVSPEEAAAMEASGKAAILKPNKAAERKAEAAVIDTKTQKAEAPKSETAKSDAAKS